MVKHIRLGSVSDVPSGEGRSFQVGALRVAVFHTREGRIFATQGECPHRGGPLADGLVGGTTLICPLHEWSFDLVSGMALGGSCGIRVYPITKKDDGTLVLDVDEGGVPPAWRTSDYSKEQP